MAKKVQVEESAPVEAVDEKPVAEVAEAPPAAPASYGFARWLIVTQNPSYSGKVFGIPVANGIAIADPASLDPKLGWPLSVVINELRSMPGYTVTELVGDPSVAIRTVREDQAAKEAGEVAILKMLSDANIAAKVREYLEAKQG